MPDDGFVIETQSLSPLSIRELVINYLRAVERFRTHYLQSRNPANQLESASRGYAALSEALDWADSIDNYLREGPRDSAGTNRDKRWADSLPDDQRELVLALQRVRNLVHHRWWQAVSTRISRNDHGEQGNQWVWGRLPEGAGQGRGRSSELDAAYTSRLLGRDLLNTLDDLGLVFWARRGWAIRRDAIEQPGHSVLSSIVFDAS